MDHIDRWAGASSIHFFTVIYSYENKGKRGENMTLSLSAIAMLVFGSVVLYGGLAYFLYRALKGKKK